MIVANLRRTLGRADAQLAVRLAARGSDHELQRLETTLREDGLDAILDDPRLLSALLETPRGARRSARRRIQWIVAICIAVAIRERIRGA